MGNKWSTFWYEHDPDDVFAYTTLKMVKIRDRYLGLLHYAFMFAIFFYIVVWVLLIKMHYVDLEAPVGSVALASNLTKTDINTRNYPYCLSHSSPIDGALPCAIMDPFEAVYPLFEQSAIFFTTRLSAVKQRRNCPEFSLECDGNIFSDVDRDDYYVTDIEDFMVHVSHSVQAPTFSKEDPASHSFRGQSVHMTGYLIEDIKTDSKITVPSGHADVFPLSTFLKAADVGNLDAGSDVVDQSWGGSGTATFRYTGIVLVVSIIYDNMYIIPFSPQPSIQYTYQIVRVQETEFRVFEIYNRTQDERWVYDRHGIRIIFVQAGSLARFQFQTLMVQLVTSLALLKISTTIVDQIALKALPQRSHYKKYKYELTEDFSDVRDNLVDEKKLRSALEKPVGLKKYEKYVQLEDRAAPLMKNQVQV